MPTLPAFQLLGQHGVTFGRREQRHQQFQAAAQIAAGHLARAGFHVDIAAGAVQVQGQGIFESLPRVVAKSLVSLRTLVCRRTRACLFGSNTVEFMPVICRRWTGKASHLLDRGKRASIATGSLICGAPPEVGCNECPAFSRPCGTYATPNARPQR